MRVLMLEPGQDARMEKIPSDPAQLERILGGRAEITAPFESGILLVMLRDQRGQRPNRLIGSRKVYGRCLLSGVSLHGLDDLPAALLERYRVRMDRCRLE